VSIISRSVNPPIFESFLTGSFWIRGTLISPTETGLWEKYSFIYLNGQLKAELTVCRTLSPEPEPDALFGKNKYVGDAFC
jgi:hypothetical protein